MNKSKSALWQCSDAAVNPRADVTLYPFCSSSISRVARRAVSYETERMRLDMEPYSERMNAPCQQAFFSFDRAFLGGFCLGLTFRRSARFLGLQGLSVL